MTDAGRALEGLRVVDFTSFLPGPYATMILADHGADVVKVERPGLGDPGRHSEPTVAGVAARHGIVNRGKRSVTIDLRGSDGSALARALVDRADVLVEGFRSGTMARLGLDYDTVAETNPGLVYCSLGGFDSVSEEADEPGHDLNFMGLAGLLSADPRTGELALPLTQYADIAGGSFRAVMGILMALQHRHRTGRGQRVEASLMAGALSLQMEAAAHATAGREFSPGRTRLTGAYPCYQVYRTSDGRFMAVGATEPHYWANLCEAVGRPDLVPLQYATGVEGDAALEALTATFATRTQAEWERTLATRQTCCTPVRTFSEACPPGTVRPSPVVLHGTPAWVSGAAPRLGEHNDEVLSELCAEGPQGGG